MKHQWPRRALVTTALAAALAACSSPIPVLYTIAPVSGPVQNRGPQVIVLQEIGLARYLERSEIVRSSENYRLDVMSNDWWGEPLSAMLSRILLEELSQRLPRSTIVSSGGAVSVSPDATVEVNVERLDKDTAGHLVLQAQASVSFNRRAAPIVRSFRFSETPSVAGTSGEVAAISAAVGRLADGVVPMLLTGASTR